MSEHATATTSAERLLTVKQVREIVPVTRQHLYTLSRTCDFPAPLQLSNNRIAWRESEVIAWIETRKRVPRRRVKR